MAFGDMSLKRFGRGGAVIGSAAGIWALTHRRVGRHASTERGRKEGVLSTITTGSLSAAAGYGVFRAAPPLADKGLQALRQRALLDKGKSTVFGQAEKLFSKIDGSSSFARTLAGPKGVSLAAGLVAIPIAHRLVQRAVAGWTRRHEDHREAGYMPSIAMGQHGKTGGRVDSGWQPRFGGSGPAVLKTTGRVRTHYNADQARKMVGGR